jgi:Family of unknown function (DUF6418)
LLSSSLASDPFIFALLSLAAAGAIFVVIAWIALRRPAIGMIFFFILFGFAWRLVSVLYIDIGGPLSSEQLERNVGPGISAVPLAVSQGLVIGAFLFSFRRKRIVELRADDVALRLARYLPARRLDLSDIAFALAALFVLGLWIELVVRGPIPLFVGMERFDYARLYGGPLHHILLDWGAMLVLQLGIFLAVPLLHGRPFDRRFAGLFAAVMLYLFLVGHRFSSLYVSSSFFIIPVGAVLLVSHEAAFSWRKVFPGKALRHLAVASVGLICLVGSAIAYSYTVVRGFEGNQLLAKLIQRMLVQQGEMWWMTYERVFLQANWDSSFAAYKLIVAPFDPSRNSTMQFLMERGLPIARAHDILAQGSAYTGGWPEVLFELGGPVGGFLLVIVSAIIFSEFTFLLARCLVEERFATCFFLTPILFALSINLASGMINSFVQISFLIKVAVALAVYVIEQEWRLSVLSCRGNFSLLSSLQKE